MARRIRFIKGSAVFGVRNCSGFIGIVPEASRIFRKGTNVAPPSGRGHGPMRECPGRIGTGAQGPIGPNRPARDKPQLGLLEGGESPCPPLLLPWPPAQGLEEGQGLD